MMRIERLNQHREQFSGEPISADLSMPDLAKERLTEPEAKETIFTAILEGRLSNDYHEAMISQDFSDEEINGFLDALYRLPDGEIKAVLSVPWEIRKGIFARYHEQMQNGEIKPAEIVDDLKKKMTLHGFTLGYHLSNADITPEKSNDGTEMWTIKGTEIDARDNKLMAYYSLDYQNIFRKRGGKYLYVVRAEKGERASHRYDPSNNWGRAPILSVVDRFIMNVIDDRVEDLYHEKYGLDKTQ